MIVLSGTNRPNSITRRVASRILDLACELTPIGSPNVPVLMDLTLLKSDLFLPSCYQQKPSWFELEFQKAVSEAQGMIIVAPEYNGSFPGILKYFIDMLHFPGSLTHLPTAFIGIASGQFGGLRAVEHLEGIFSYRHAHVFGERVLIPFVDKVIQPDNTLGIYEPELQELISGFLRFVRDVSQSKSDLKS
jgi:NAD(P)H-dependent FMN reductase